MGLLGNLDTWHLVILVLAGLFIFGERLPQVISEAFRVLRQARKLATSATAQLSQELGTDISLEDLHPKTLIRKHLFSEDDEAALRAPLQQLVDDLQATATALDPTSLTTPRPAPAESVIAPNPSIPGGQVPWDAT